MHWYLLLVSLFLLTILMLCCSLCWFIHQLNNILCAVDMFYKTIRFILLSTRNKHRALQIVYKLFYMWNLTNNRWIYCCCKMNCNLIHTLFTHLFRYLFKLYIVCCCSGCSVFYYTNSWKCLCKRLFRNYFRINIENVHRALCSSLTHTPDICVFHTWKTTRLKK